jgi:protein-S-isoprenylcysteine O-methyltransferase Ste14
MWAAMSLASSAIKTGIFTLLVPAVVAIWIPQSMLGAGRFEHSSPMVCVAGGLLFVLGVIGYFWCAALFVRALGTPAPLSPTKTAVVSGPYRVNRNPMYTSVLAVVFGQALFYGRWKLAAYGALLAICFHLFVVLYEERDLRERFDSEYEEFCQRVPRWIPQARRSHPMAKNGRYR